MILFRLMCFVLCLCSGSAVSMAAERGRSAVPPLGSLTELARFYGFKNVQDSRSTLTLRSKFSDLRLIKGSRKSTYNGLLIYMNGPSVKGARGWTLSDTDVLRGIDPLLRSQVYLVNAGHRVVVIDPGHGGEDSGTVGRRSVKEKDVVMAISKRVAAKLRLTGVTIRMTRETDKAVDLGDRARKAKAWSADVFVSIHVNASGSSVARGHETYVLSAAGYPSTNSTKPVATAYPGNRFDRENQVLGYFVQKGLVAAGGSLDRGVKRARFKVLREAPCPSVLVECGFVSNSAEEARLRSAAYQEKLADGIVQGVLSYLSRVRDAQMP